MILRRLLAILVLLLPASLYGFATAARGVESVAAPRQEASSPTALPDLRIVRIVVAPQPMVDGNTATVTVLIHNRSSAVAAGTIVVKVVHDRSTPQPVALDDDVIYLAADELAELRFEVAGISMDASPYTFFAMVDVSASIEEFREFNNVGWTRATVCGGASRQEVADGLDNDCDGMIDEELGLPPDAGDAVRMLRELQRQARLDAVSLAFALARPFAPSAVEAKVRLVSEDGFQVGTAGAGGPTSATQPPVAGFGAVVAFDDPSYHLTLVDWNGELLRSGDLVSFRTRDGGMMVAVAGGGGAVVASRRYDIRETLFRVVAGRAGDEIRDGSDVFLLATTGDFVSAEQGGGGVLRADRDQAGGWETFSLYFALNPTRR